MGKTIDYNGFIIINAPFKSKDMYFILNKETSTKVNNIAISTLRKAKEFVDSLK